MDPSKHAQPKRGHGKYSRLRRELSIAIFDACDERVCAVTVTDKVEDDERQHDFEIVAAHTAGGHSNAALSIPSNMTSSRT